MQDLSKVISDINSKTSVINDIVFKTQLLSFNASIEAARAGQHGRGFAVVAEEVGNLAEMSGNASREIEKLLEDSQRKVNMTLETIQGRVSDGNNINSLAHQAFEEISKLVKEINHQIKSITEATQQQEIGVQQTNSAMKQMDTASESNNKSSHSAFNKSNELKQQSEELNNIVKDLHTYINGGSSINYSANSKLKNLSLDKRIKSKKSEDSFNNLLNSISKNEVDINHSSNDINEQDESNEFKRVV